MPAVQVHLKPEELAAIKILSRETFGKANVSGYMAMLAIKAIDRALEIRAITKKAIAEQVKIDQGKKPAPE